MNTVVLGLIQTSHNDWDFLAEDMDKMANAYPLRRIGQLTDVAPMITFLASAGANWVTGQAASENGGFAMV